MLNDKFSKVLLIYLIDDDTFAIAAEFLEFLIDRQTVKK